MKKRGFGSPVEAEAAFYAAFERADPVAMREVWDDSGEIECIHPMGGRVRGEAVHASWQEVFKEASPIAFHISERQRFAQDAISVHMVQQNILFQDANEQPLSILATNVYRLCADGWRMVLHHASPAPHIPTTPLAPARTMH